MVSRHSESASASKPVIKCSARAERAMKRGAKDDRAVVLRHPKVAALEHEALLVASEVQDWIQSRDGVAVRLNFSQPDRLKLLRLRTWEIVYCVSLFEILDIIVAPIRQHSVGKLRGTKWRYGLGTSVSSLTGWHAEQILTTIIGRRYPTNEHLGFWREQERDRQLEAERMDACDGQVLREARKSPEDFESLDDYMADYNARVKKARDRERVAVDAEWRRRKAYRWNPWRDA